MIHHPRLISLSRQALQSNGRFAVIHLALGELFPLDEGQLRAQWEDLTKATLAEVVLSIRVIRAEQQCMLCFQKYQPAQKEISCPHCGSVGAKIIAGEECFIESYEALDE